MSRPFDVSVETDKSVEAVFDALSREQYWQERVDSYGGSMSLGTMDVASDGAVLVTTIQDLQKTVIPAAFNHLVFGGATVTRAETWRLAGDGTAVLDLAITAHGVPASGGGSGAVAPTPGGSRLSIAGRVKVKIPLLGGQIEKYVVSQIVGEIPEIQAFTDGWITRNS